MPVIESPKDAHVSAYQFVEQATDIDEPASTGLWRLFFKAAGAYIRKRGAAAIRLLTESDLVELTFPTGARIKGDWSTGTDSDKPSFQTSVVNGSTIINVFPNGTAEVAGHSWWAKSDPTNAPYIFVGISPTHAAIQVTRRGSGSLLPLGFFVGGLDRMRIMTDGKVGVGTSTPTALFDVNSDIMRLRTAKTPASASAAGNQGDICWDANYLYVCTATNTWKRLSLSSW